MTLEDRLEVGTRCRYLHALSKFTDSKGRGACVQAYRACWSKPFLCLMYSPCSYHQNELLIKSLHQPQPEIWLIKTEAFSKRSYKWPAAACDVTAIISAMAAMCKLKLYKYYSLSFLINVCYTGINTWLIIRVLGVCPGGLGQNPP